MADSFSSKMFSMVKPILGNIYKHPFVKELCLGTLPRDKFVYYMQQDSLYLVDYARALAIVAAKAHGEKAISLGLAFAEGALIAERSLHAEYFASFAVEPAEEKMPACFMYTSHLLNITSLDSVGEGMAALLPCFWIYNEVGKYILSCNVQGNPYQKWIDTYAGTDFEHVTNDAINYTNSLAEQSSGNLRLRMEAAFVNSCKMEYYFWDDAYNMRSWGV